MQVALEKLPIEERLNLISQIWDSINEDCAKNKQNLDIPDSHKKILQERLATYQQDGEKGIKAEDFVKQLRNQSRQQVAG